MSGGIAAALPEMLGRLKLNAIRDRLDGLLDEAAHRDLTLRETLVLLCEAEVAHREERRCQATSGNHPLATSGTHPPGCPLLPECLGG